MLEYFMLTYIVRKHMDIRISDGFGFGARAMPMDTFVGGQRGDGGFGYRSGFGISVQTLSITIYFFT
jgi:hypothetical protein